MKRPRQSGFSLVELMIAILLAAITGIVVLNVLTSYQSRSNTMTGRNDAEISAAMSLYSLEKDVRMGGAGLTTPRGLLCPQGVNIAWGGVAVSNGAPLLPVRIIDGGAGPDAIEIIRSDSQFGAAPSRLVANMASATAQLSVDGLAGFQNNDLVMVGSSDGIRVCTLMQLTAAPTANGSGWLLTHGAGVGNYNPANPGTTFASAPSYQARDLVVNMGSYGVRRFGIVCNSGAVPVATNNCDLAFWNALDAGVTTAIAPQIVDLQAQYGIANAGSETVNAWVDATTASGWDAPTLADHRRIRAIRIAIVARGAREGGANPQVGPASVELWRTDPDDASTARTRAFNDDERRFRYQTLTVVIPLINQIWAGT